MNTQDIAVLEEQFKITLPEDYASVVTGEVAAQLSAMALEVDPAILREANENHRKDCPWGFAWRDSFWWIGEDGAGGFYFIDTEEKTSTVYYFDHESSPLTFDDREPFYPSDIGNHVSDEVEIEAEMKVHDRRMALRVAERKWWQFWVPKVWPPTNKQEG